MSENEKKKKISIGVEDFKTLLDWDGYFVDKTLMIRDLIERNAVVTLFTRPRRFGKTLNQFMLRRFFEEELTAEGEKIENGYLFDGLEISRCGEKYFCYQQKYPVIFMSLKSAKQPDFHTAYTNLKYEIQSEFSRHQYVLKNPKLDPHLKELFTSIWYGKAEPGEYSRALQILSECLFKYHGKKTMILIDEYDVPLENAYFEGFFDQMSAFIRAFFESALKTNPFLEKSVITGCLRISKESIFTGLNNLEIDTVLHTRYEDAFGFTQKEVSDMLSYYSLDEDRDEVKQWYDGYLFGSTEIYNPWSILKYVNDHNDSVTKFPLPYWSNTSSNSIIREMVEDADDETRFDLETLMDGGTIRKLIHEDITYGDIHESMDNLWNFLFFTGYLKKVSEQKEKNRLSLEMKIPNLEVESIYEDSISHWFNQKMKKTDRSPLIQALESGDSDAVQEFINRQLMDTISFFDYAENYYHGFMTGLLLNAGPYRVLSNRESGNGRPDIVLTELKFMGHAIILGLKISDSFRGMEKKCEEGLNQIKAENYALPLKDDGYQEVLKYAICFFKKGCMVKKAE